MWWPRSDTSGGCTVSERCGGQGEQVVAVLYSVRETCGGQGEQVVAVLYVRHVVAKGNKGNKWRQRDKNCGAN